MDQDGIGIRIVRAWFATSWNWKKKEIITITAGVIGDEIAVLVDVMTRVQRFLLRLNVMKALAVEDDAAQSSASR